MQKVASTRLFFSPDMRLPNERNHFDKATSCDRNKISADSEFLKCKAYLYLLHAVYGMSETAIYVTVVSTL